MISLNQVSSYCYKGLKLTYNTQEDLNKNFSQYNNVFKNKKYL